MPTFRRRLLCSCISAAILRASFFDLLEEKRYCYKRLFAMKHGGLLLGMQRHSFGQAQRKRATWPFFITLETACQRGATGNEVQKLVKRERSVAGANDHCSKTLPSEGPELPTRRERERRPPRLCQHDAPLQETASAFVVNVSLCEQKLVAPLVERSTSPPSRRRSTLFVFFRARTKAR